MTNPIALKRLQIHVVQTQSRLYGACANESPLKSEGEAQCHLFDSMSFHLVQADSHDRYLPTPNAPSTHVDPPSQQLPHGPAKKACIDQEDVPADFQRADACSMGEWRIRRTILHKVSVEERKQALLTVSKSFLRQDIANFSFHRRNFLQDQTKVKAHSTIEQLAHSRRGHSSSVSE